MEMGMSRGGIVTAVMAGDYGKPRPVLIVQDDAFIGLASVTVLPLTSDLQESPLFRIAIEPTQENGLRSRSQIMIDKAATIARRKIGTGIGRVDNATMRIVDRALARFLGLE
jgi:mRNA interferase MazF